MPSQFFGLNIAYTGLQASNAWLTTTANNIANVETEGYSRQEVKQEAALALRTFTSYGMAGSGVDAKAIEQVRNQFYDLKYWNSNATLGSFEVKEDYVKQIEDYFTETDMVAGFGTIFADMFAGLDEVYKSAGSASTKTQFLYLAGNLGEYLTTIGIDAQMLQERILAEPVVALYTSYIWYDAAAEVEGKAAIVSYDLWGIGILHSLHALKEFSECADLSLRCIEKVHECFHL